MLGRALTSALGLLIAAVATLGGGEAASASSDRSVRVSLVALFEPSAPAETTQLSSKWSRVLAATQNGRQPCPTEVRTCRDWAELRSLLAAERNDVARAARVNATLNEIAYRSDERLWDASDYWATPAEFLARGGDCEDFAIAKYFMLRELGVPVEAMRIAVVHNTVRNEMHAVLVVQTSQGPFVLDNLATELVPARGARQYETLFAVNQSSIWVYIPLTRSSTAAGAE
jgi:predicted transglutaminase-like cysteine proteinase